MRSLYLSSSILARDASYRERDKLSHIFKIVSFPRVESFLISYFIYFL